MNLRCVRILVAFTILGAARGENLVASIADQEMALINRGRVVARYVISTSQFGVGDEIGSYRTPTGDFYVSAKIGDGLAAGAVIKRRMPTGEIVQANAPGRDAIVSRVIWLRGTEISNRNARERCIYIHGTPEERLIGRRTSFGCIRMRSRDIIALYQRVHIGTHIQIIDKPLRDILPAEEPTLLARSD
jgi:lipoprotein-anchoring transpeptidase ErfK/SrfK